MRAPLYVGTPAQEIPLDLLVEANKDGDVFVSLSASTVAEAKIAAFEAMLVSIRQSLEGLGGTFCVGRPQHVAWDYLSDPKRHNTAGA